MEISDNLKKFLSKSENQGLIDKDEFEIIYKKLYESPLLKFNDVSEFTQLLYKVNIDPLIYMDSIPKGFLCNYNSKNKFKIPRHILEIEDSAFYNSSIGELYIPESIQNIHANALDYFTGMINYEGTEDDFLNKFRGGGATCQYITFNFNVRLDY